MATAKKSQAKKNKNNTSGYHGVTGVPGKYYAQIFHLNKTHRSKTSFKKAVEAANEYDRMAIELKGNKAKLNFPSKTKAE